MAAASVAVASGAVGVVTFIRADEGALSEGLLAVFVAAIVVAWVLAEVVRTIWCGPRSGARLTDSRRIETMW